MMYEVMGHIIGIMPKHESTNHVFNKINKHDLSIDQIFLILLLSAMIIRF